MVAPPNPRGRRQDLLAAARRAIAEKGYARTTIADVAEGAGVAKGTVYLYFQTKDEIFEALLDELFADVRSSMEVLFAGGPAALASPEIFVAGALELARCYRENMEVVTLAQYEMSTQKGPLGDRMIAFSNDLVSRMSAFIAQGIEEGVFRPVNPTVAAIAANSIGERIVLALANGLHGLPEPEAVLRDLHTILYGGLLLPAVPKIGPAAP